MEVVTLDWQSPEIAVWREWCSQTDVSPFQTPSYLQLFAKHFLSGQVFHPICVKRDGQPVAFGGLVFTNGVATALGMQPVEGGQEITDYFDLVFQPNATLAETSMTWDVIRQWVDGQGIHTIQLDYLLATKLSYQVLRHSPSLVVEPLQQEVAPIVSLPADWMTYVAGLKKKYRDELKRKLKRLDQSNPQYELEVQPDTTATSDFIRLHRLSDAAKQHFMTPAMADFFNQLATAVHDGGWQWRYAFVSLAGIRVAAVAYFQRAGDSRLLYNSGYDPAYRQQGVGFCLVARLLQNAIEQNYRHFDFLRGSERYKYELGGVDQSLFRVQLHTH